MAFRRRDDRCREPEELVARRDVLLEAFVDLVVVER